MADAHDDADALRAELRRLQEQRAELSEGMLDTGIDDGRMRERLDQAVALDAEIAAVEARLRDTEMPAGDPAETVTPWGGGRIFR